MTIARSTGAFIGTSETQGVPVAAGSIKVGDQQDMLADNASIGLAHIYLIATVTAGGAKDANVRVQLKRARATGQSYDDVSLVYEKRLEKDGTTQKVYLGPCLVSRYMSATLTNAYDKDLTGVAVLYELEKSS